MASQVILRLIHVICGIFWVGATFFTVLFLLPAMKDAGADGAKVMHGIARRKYMQVMPVVALLTMISGLWMLSRDSAGFHAEYFATRPGMAYSTGAAAAIIAFLTGFIWIRPAMAKATELSQAAGGASPEERATIMASAAALRSRANSAGNVVAVLLLIAAAAMAVARYL
jgi:hypothetical protein